MKYMLFTVIKIITK